MLRYNNTGFTGNPSYTMNENLNKVYSQDYNLPLSVINEPSMEYTTHDNYLSISSSNRDVSSYPLHYSYRINLDQPFKNVKKIEMISAILPNQPATVSSGDILNEPYLIIDVEEFNYIEFPNNVGSSALKGFSILPLKSPTKSTGGFINPELGCIYHKSKVFKESLASLSSITIRIRDHQGNLYDFGQGAGSTNKDYQNHFIFKITTEEVSRKKLNHRSVY
jgi:hypothetical protein